MMYYHLDRDLGRWVLLTTLCWLFPGMIWSQDPSSSVPAGVSAPTNRVPQSLAELRALEEQLKQVVERVTPAVVGLSGGSGVVIDADGHVLTAGHVGGRSGRDVSVTFADGKRLRARTLGNNRGIDSGLAKLKQEGDWPHVAIGSSAEVTVGQWCLAIGFPASFSRQKQPPVRIGRVLAVTNRMIVTDCPLMGGDSGGPLFDLQGRVIGINSRVGGTVIANVHVPVDAYKKEWDRLVAGEDWNDRQSRRQRQQRKPPSSDKPKSPQQEPELDERPPEPRKEEQDTQLRLQSSWNQLEFGKLVPAVGRHQEASSGLPLGSFLSR